MKHRLDHLMVAKELVTTRSQAESYIRLGVVRVDGKVQTKPGYFVDENSKVGLHSDQYVSRAGLKLASVAMLLKLDFKGKNVLDVGSSTGGFTDYALQHGAKKVVAVDVGTNQLHPKLRKDTRVELHEQTDIRSVRLQRPVASSKVQVASNPVPEPLATNYMLLTTAPDIILVDVSFISMRELLPTLAAVSSSATALVAMLKPQFEAGKNQVNKGVIKNDRMRRDILKDFETWSRQLFVIKDKADSDVHGEKGNAERFYLLKIL
ncbi:TlyA family rRNA (cytidine-2'-O)-methyltransferase [soil metagenome]